MWITAKPEIVNNGSVNLPLTFSQVLSAAGLVTDGLGYKTPSGSWIRADISRINYSVVSNNTTFVGGNVEAIVIGR